MHFDKARCSNLVQFFKKTLMVRFYSSVPQQRLIDK
jgi:hypothetical protein